MPRLTHLNADGNAEMVDVGDKEITQRIALARSEVQMSPATLEMIRSGDMPKGDVFATARIAGIMAAKRTPELIPLCHTLLLTKVAVEFEIDAEASRVLILTTVQCSGKTGVEMEALTAASVAALTIYDMAKAVDKAMIIGPIMLIEKQGGRSGTWRREETGTTP